MIRIFLSLISLIFIANTTIVAQQPVSINFLDHEKNVEQNITKVEMFVLDNGLTVYLNEDHTQSKVFGAVVIKGGARRDPKDATGIAHYFEHIMFKGTSQIGTTNYKEEKIYLDSIRMMYDLLANAGGNAVFIKEIQAKINRLSLKAAEYAIPNEFDKIISDMGGTGLNAYTSFENIVYHNTFPPESIEKWMKVYAHRIDDPVFRLFQSELETVYEEKNMSMDNFGNNIFETLYANFYPNSPYGQQTVLGSVEHLKNPSLTKMMSYFKDYYCANNMALVLCGDFNPDQAKAMIQQYFGKLRQGNPSPAPVCTEVDFKGRVVVEKRMSPIPVGIIGFRSISEKSNEKVAFDVLNKILSNENGTGLLDELSVNGKLMMAQTMSDLHPDLGGQFILFVPKFPFQSLTKAENIILAELEKLKKGDFDDTLFFAVKNELLKNHLQSLENMEYRQYFIIQSFMDGKSWDEYMEYSTQLNSITKKDVVDAAKKYFTENYFVLQSKMGSPKKTKLDKPDYKEIKIKNSDATSEYALEINRMSSPEVNPRFIDFNRDLQILDVMGNDLYITKNPMNSIFSLQLKFGIGTFEIPELEYAASYLNSVGSKEIPYSTFRKQLQSRGVSISTWSDRDYFYISVDGYDKDLEFAVKMIKDLVSSTEENKDKIAKLAKDEKVNRKMETKELSNESDILYSYAFYGEKSPYLKRLSMKDIKGLKMEDLRKALDKAMKYKCQIHIVSNRDQNEIARIFQNSNLFQQESQSSNSPIIIEPKVVETNTILFVNDKNAIQSHIKILIPSVEVPFEKRYVVRPFNEYFGSGMYSLVFQEIREFHSFAYSSWGYFSNFYNFTSKGYFVGGLTTQSDKSYDAISTYLELINSMPQKPERTETIKNQMVLAINSDYPGFRSLSRNVAYYRLQGFTNDPNQLYYKKHKDLTFAEINEFYETALKNRKYVITIVGNKEKIDFESLKKYGVIKEVELKDLLKN